MSPASSSNGGRRRVAGERGRDRGPASAVSTPVLQKRPAKDRSGDTSVKTPLWTPRASGDMASSEASGRPSGAGLALRVVAVLLAVVLVTAAVVVLVADRRQQLLADSGAEATAAARSAAEVVLSYDFETLDEDFAAAQDVSTGTFKEEYAQTSENAIREVATQTQAQVKAEALTAGVVSATPDEVVVLVFVDQTTLSNRLDQPQTDQNRVRFTMVRTAVDGQDRWLVSEVDAL